MNRISPTNYINLAIDVKVDAQGCGLAEGVADLRFELGVKCIVADAELVLVGVAHAQLLQLQNSGLPLPVCEPVSLNQIQQRDGHDDHLPSSVLLELRPSLNCV